MLVFENDWTSISKTEELLGIVLEERFTYCMSANQGCLLDKEKVKDMFSPMSQ